jgi:hypothetical protein
MTHRTVSLIATIDFIKKYFPDRYREPSPGCKAGIMSAPFPIDPSACTTALGRWLAEHICTTRSDDDGSWCSILLPATEMGLTFRELGEQLLQRQQADFAETERVLTMIENWTKRQRQIIAGYGAAPFSYRVIHFLWPVFGSLRVRDATTPEGYFDACARQIRSLGGVVLAAGLSRKGPPNSLVDTMARRSGGGIALLRRYKESSSATFGSAPESE